MSEVAPIGSSETKTLRINTILTRKYVRCRLKATDRDGLIDELIELLADGHPWVKGKHVKEAILEREALFPTVIVPGLTVPHARLPELSSPLIAVGLAPEGIDFGIPETETEKVKVAILLLTPQNNPALHLQMLSGLAQTFSRPGALDQLLACRTPAEVVELLTGERDQVPSYLKAGDLMDVRFTALLETDTLRRAIHLFATTGEAELPVIDDDGDLRGVLSTTDLLKLSLPAHLLWMEDLTPINRFQPFADMLKSAGDTRLGDIMRDDYLAVAPALPAIQLAKLFIVNQVGKIAVTEGNKLVGMVRLSDFCTKLFWD